MKLRIPKRFNLHGQTVTVVYDNTLLEDASARGMFHPLPQLIQLNPADPEAGHSRSGVEQTFCHELTHSILYAMGELKLYNNEKFVDLFGHLLHQALTTQEFK